MLRSAIILTARLNIFRLRKQPFKTINKTASDLIPLNDPVFDEKSASPLSPSCSLHLKSNFLHLKSTSLHLKSASHHLKSASHHLKSASHHLKSASHHFPPPGHYVEKGGRKPPTILFPVMDYPTARASRSFAYNDRRLEERDWLL